MRISLQSQGGEGFLHQNTKSKNHKGKNVNWITLKSKIPAQHMTTKTKDTDQKKVFSTQITGKGLIQLYRELYKTMRKGQTTKQRYEQAIHSSNPSSQ